jgi:ATP-dependent Zn protease
VSNPELEYQTEYEESSDELAATRKPLEPWDRVKFLLLFIVAWLAFVMVAANNNPLESIQAVARNVSRNEWWLLLLMFVELVRQGHFFVAERNARWNQFWSERALEPFHRLVRDWDDWTRFRIARVAKIVLVLALLSIVLAAHYHTSPFVAIFLAPVALANSLPTLVQYVLLIGVVVLQFVAIFWFMSKGGVEVYFPGDVKTRFSDVWGQDRVLELVKENIIYLKDPELIEERGGYVPGGILLWGPPGTGKTLIAEAVAGETENPYVFVDPGAFTNMFFGVGILKVKSLFRKLRKLAVRYGGVVVFFDEADSLGSRGAMASSAEAGMTMPWSDSSCRGIEYLSPSTQRQVTQLMMSRSSDSADMTSRRSRFVFPGGMNGANGGGMGSFDGTLQSLLTELSGLKKPRGFFNRVVRRALGLAPKDPPKYRILIMMATNMPQSLDPALLRPGRIDRIYKVGYPSKDGRIRTYKGYLDKVAHALTDEQIERLAIVTPYATGATIKDLVNEALINTIREGREVVEWKDIIKAKQLKELGPSEDVEYIERERHAVAIHEACHAVAASRVRQHMAIDIATIEKSSTYLGMVASIPPEEQFTRWRSEYESDIMVSLASLAGERMFFSGDNSSGVSGDLESATAVASLMEANWGMGSTISSQQVTQQLGVGGGSAQGRRDGRADATRPKNMGDRIEAKLESLYRETIKLLEENRASVLAIAHALETHKTVTGEDVEAIMNRAQGPLIDGTIYGDPEFIRRLEEYHEAAADAHRRHANVRQDMPRSPLASMRYAPTGGSEVAWTEES